ncbi:MAG: thiamine pyrophosphate-binding protein, partial [Acidobacteria bacterium]|nr:thiamine pyrophosphate-binding protein [Acidobacteriota bacterium]
MRITGARRVVQALVDGGADLIFGIPGTHNIELYDELERSSLRPVLVTDEQAASFMADGVSRTSDRVGVLNLVPGAGVTNALSGIAEAFMDCVPMVVLASGIRTDTGRAYQLHAIDQLAVLAPVTKAAVRARTVEEIYPRIREAFVLAREGRPGPVAVEVPANLLMLTFPTDEPAYDQPSLRASEPDPSLLEAAARELNGAARPALYLGLGAAGAAELLPLLAERLGAPVATTIQGKGVFPESHPLWLWNGFGASAPPFVSKIMESRDVLLAIGCRFGEVATGSYGMAVPENLIHVDIDPGVFGRNHPARVAVESDARAFVEALLPLIRKREDDGALEVQIAAGHDAVRRRWEKETSDARVTPYLFFQALQRYTGPDTVYTTDSGNGTFLAMEHLRLERPGRFIGPVDFSCMGYSVPAAIGAKMAEPERDVVALAGDGALLMTGMELLSAASNGAGVLVCVLRDGRLGQIAQFQKVPFNRETCTVLPDYRVEDFARTTGCRYFRILRDTEVDSVL